MNKTFANGAAFDDSQGRTIGELEKKVEQFGKYYNDFDEFFNDLCEYYNGFPEFYEHVWKKSVREWVKKWEERYGQSIYEDAQPDEEAEEAKVIQFMVDEAAKRDAEVDAALAKAKASREAEALAEEVLTSPDAGEALAAAKAEKDPEKALAMLDDYIASREAEIIGSRLNSKESFEAAPDDLPPMQDRPQGGTSEDDNTDEITVKAL